MGRGIANFKFQSANCGVCAAKGDMMGTKISEGEAQGALVEFLEKLLANYNAKYALETECVIHITNNMDNPEIPYFSLSIDMELDTAILPSESMGADIQIANMPADQETIEFRIYYAPKK